MAQITVNSRASSAATLLRNSRLFSLPTPIKPLDFFPATRPQGYSETSTTPFPTHASIKTVNSSLGKGDWGLKRPLPLRSTTRTSNPIIRVHGVDTIDHITDFASAADHSLTLEKWQELCPVLRIPAQRRKDYTTGQDVSPSVFESWVDNSRDLSGIHPSQNKTAGRWTFEGPWLAGQNEVEFVRYLKKRVKPRKAAFYDFIRQRFTQQEIQNRRDRAQAEGNQGHITSVTITADQFSEYIRMLSNNREYLGRLIHDFLDLPQSPSPWSDPRYSHDAIPNYWGDSGHGHRSLGSPSPNYYALEGPPITHPSAGFSYLRTSSHIYNHPLLGPQLNASIPVHSRVLLTRNKAFADTKDGAVVGVAGLASTIPVSKAGGRTNYSVGSLINFDPDIRGGGKIWVQNSHFYIDSRGRINFKPQRASSDSVAIYTVDKDLPQDTGRTEDEIAGGSIPDYLRAATQTPALSASYSRSQNSGYGLEQTLNSKYEHDPTSTIKSSAAELVHILGDPLRKR